MSEILPSGWAITILGDLSEYITSGSRDWSKYYADQGALFIRTQDINQNKVAAIHEIARVALPKRVEGKRTLVRKGDLLITITGANVGKCAYVVDELPEAYVSQSVALVRLADGFSGSFIHHQLITSSSEDGLTILQRSAYGVGRPVLNLDNVREVPISLAPLNEQDRIDKKLDLLIPQVEACNERLKHVPPILKRFRQAVLAAACSGRLTDEWREKAGLSNGDEEAELPFGWRRTRVGELVPKGGIFDGPFGSNLKTADYTGSGIRVIRLENIGQLRFNGEKETYISQRKYESLTKHTVNDGDIIFASFIDEEIRACVLPHLKTKAIAKADCFCLRPHSDVDRRYLTFQLISRESYDQLVQSVHGATRPRINITQLRNLEVRMCPIDEQHEIVRRVEALFQLADTIEKRIAAAILQAEKLTQAILAKAFCGELVPTEAELARREGRSYEPASALLARIRVERKNSTAPTKSKSTRLWCEP